MRVAAISCLVLFPALALAAEESLTIHRPASVRLGFETITLPGNESMGMVGGSYLIETLPNLYLGPAAYGAITGQRGGFFTGGGEVAYRLPLARKLALETGLYVGGGGGGGTDAVGGGLMLRPHVDLLWDFGGVRAGVSASMVRFPNGSIRSNQIGAVLSFDTQFIHASADQAGQTIAFRERGGVGFDRIALQGGVYKPRPGVTDSAGQPATGKIGFAGFRAERRWQQGWVWGVEASGAAKGGADGYAEVLGTLAWEKPLIAQTLYVGIRGSYGMGGGGSIAMGGGQLAKAAVYATMPLSRNLYLSAEGGHAFAPDGQFRANFATLNLGLILDRPVFQDNLDATSTIQGWEWSGSVQRYASAMRNDGNPRALDTIGFKMDRAVGNGFYLSGQAHSAMTGGAGAYSVGLFGMGWKTPKTSFGLSGGAEMLAGASGGGGVKTDGGAIMQPMLYVKQDLGRGWNIKAGAGKVRALKDGGLDSTVYDVSVGYEFGLPVR